MNDKEKLAEILKRFPGIGPRQAKRMVYFLLSADRTLITDMAKLISTIQENISICSLCFRYFEKKDSALCNICRDHSRDQTTLMIVSKDVDQETIERSGVYKGNYFVLGGTIPFLGKDHENHIRTKELANILPKRVVQGLKEIIFALNADPEGENTTSFLEKMIRENTKFKLKLSKLGRGFSTGTEVEYSDKETLKNAISYRS